MVRAEQGVALRQVRALFELGAIGSLTDGQLLEEFRNRDGDRAEPAFRALVERHGPMVFRTCRSVLRDEQAVEDCYQATFLVLVCRARSLWVRDSLGPWLHHVALRVARSARSANFRRRLHEQQKAEQTDAAMIDRMSLDIGPVIHEELERLPEKFRAAVVLCCLEGLSQQQAAGQLGWPLGTLQSRLARRARPLAALVRRGLAPSAALFAAALSAEGANGRRFHRSGKRDDPYRGAIRGGRFGGRRNCNHGNPINPRCIENHVHPQIENRDRGRAGAFRDHRRRAVWAEQALNTDSPVGLESPVASAIMPGTRDFRCHGSRNRILR